MSKTREEIIMEQYINDYKAIEESNKKCVENIYDFEYAVEVLKRDGNLTDQIKKNEEKLNTLGVNLDLRAENAVSLMSFYEDRKVIEAENKALRTINEVIGNKEPQEMIERIKKAEHELAHTMEKNIEQQEKNIAMITNIRKVCAERIDDLKETKQDMLDENAVKESKARTLIENMKNLEAEIQKFEMFINAGILTHSQIAHINSVTNRQMDTTKLFAEIVLGREPEDIIRSYDMEDKYYKNFIKENAERVEALHTEEEITLLNKMIDDTKIIDNYVKPEIPEIKEEVIEIKKEEVKEEKPKLQIDDAYAKQFPYLFEGLELDEKKQQIPDQESDYFKQFPYIFKGVLDAEKQDNLKNDNANSVTQPTTPVEEPKAEEPKETEKEPEIFTRGYEAAMDFIKEQTADNKENSTEIETSVEQPEVTEDEELDEQQDETDINKFVDDYFNDMNKKEELDTEPSELKPAEDVKDEQPSSLSNISDENEYIYDDLDDRITITETVDNSSDFISAINNNQKEEPQQEQKPVSEDNSISEKIAAIKENRNNQQKAEKETNNDETELNNDDAELDKVEEEFDEDDTKFNRIVKSTMESKQPENEYEKEPKVGLFSRINKKIKRKRPESEHLKDAADTIAKINKEKEERKQNEFNNGRMR